MSWLKKWPHDFLLFSIGKIVGVIIVDVAHVLVHSDDFIVDLGYLRPFEIEVFSSWSRNWTPIISSPILPYQANKVGLVLNLSINSSDIVAYSTKTTASHWPVVGLGWIQEHVLVRDAGSTGHGAILFDKYGSWHNSLHEISSNFKSLLRQLSNETLFLVAFRSLCFKYRLQVSIAIKTNWIQVYVGMKYS